MEQVRDDHEDGIDEARRLAGLIARFDSARRMLDQQTTLGTADMRLMWLFTDRRSRTLRQIAEQLGLEQSTVNRQVNAAVKAGLLVRTRDAGAGSYHFAASPAGVREFDRNLATILATYRRALDALGEGRETFLALMADYVHAYRDAVVHR